MPNTCRGMLSNLRSAAVMIGVAAIFAASPALFSAAQKVPQPIPSPNAPDPNFPSGMNGPGIKDPDAKTLDRQNQAEVKAQVEKLYALVFELREQMKHYRWPWSKKRSRLKSWPKKSKSAPKTDARIEIVRCYLSAECVFLRVIREHRQSRH